MQTRSPSSAAKGAGGFTLTELLVVMLVIGVLAAVLLSVIGKVSNTSRKVQAVNDMRNIRIAITNFYQDYRKLPLNDTQQSALDYEGDDTVYGDPGGLYSSADLFDILRAIPDSKFNQDNKLNPTKVVYFEGQYAKNPSKPVSGITTQDYMDGNNLVPAGSFMDSWGHPYLVWIDANKDNDLSTAAGWFYHDIKPGSVHVLGQDMGVEFGSLGPDGQLGTKGDGILKGSDDVVTWQ